MESSDRATSAALRAMGRVDAARIEDVTAAIKARLLGTGGLVLGRYEIVRALGSGGQGIVYEGRDPVLERKVAIKVLRTRPGATSLDAHARLRREARALAQLDHPNIVRVFDIGTHEQKGVREIHVVMEYVVGTNLAHWLETPRTGDAILDRFCAAARGLAAAHRAGIVHRDFKPANVLIDDDGNPRVADFGLASVDESQAEATVDRPRGSIVDAPQRDDDLTATGDLLGTPRYMAPEQLRGDPIGPAADQYAWCVALHRALYGVEPFEAATVLELAAAKRSGPVRPLDDRGVSRGVWPLLARGMSPDPGDRHASLDALLDALGRARSRPRRRVAIAGVGVLAGLVAFAITRDVRRDPCADAAQLAVWTDADRRAWQATPAGAAARTDDLFAEQMDRYRRQFDATLAEVCGGEGVDDVETAAAIECLRMHQAQAAALLRDVARLAPELGPFSELALTLRPPQYCREPQYRQTLAQEIDPTGDATAEYEAMAYLRLGRLDEARSIALAILDADQDSSSRTLVAWNLLGVVAVAEGDLDEAARRFEATYFRASSQSNHAAAAKAAGQLAGIYMGSRNEERIALWTRNAEAALERVGGDPVSAWTLAASLGEAAWWRGDYDTAKRHQLHAIELLVQGWGEDAQSVDAVRNNLALTLERLGELDEALALHERLLATRRARTGTNHVDVYASALNLGNLLGRLGALTEASEHCREAVAAATAVFGADSLQVATARLTLAQIDLQLADDPSGEVEQMLATLHVGTGDDIESGLARMQRDYLMAWRARERGDIAGAKVAIDRAIAQVNAHLGAGNPLASGVEAEHAVVTALAGAEADGIARLRELVGNVEGSDASAAIDRGLLLTELGALLLELGHAEQSILALVEATELLGGSWVDSAHATRATNLLARAQGQ